MDQINGKLNQHRKFDLLMQRLDETPNGSWDDLGMGCEQMFGTMFDTK